MEIAIISSARVNFNWNLPWVNLKLTHILSSPMTYIYIYLFVCPELIEETTMPTGLNFAYRGILGLVRRNSSLERKITHDVIVTF